MKIYLRENLMSCGQASVANPYILEENIALLVIYYEFVMQHSIVPLWLPS